MPAGAPVVRKNNSALRISTIRATGSDVCRSRKAIWAILAATRDCFHGRASFQIEVMALRHQLHVLQRSVKRPKLTASDRFFWAGLAARMVKKLDLLESNHGCGLNGRSREKHSKPDVTQRYTSTFDAAWSKKLVG